MSDQLVMQIQNLKIMRIRNAAEIWVHYVELCERSGTPENLAEKVEAREEFLAVVDDVIRGE